jgi:hypothetical protein
MAKKAKSTTANLSVVLDGETYELIPNIAAVRAINQRFGGLNSAFQTVQALNFDSVVAIVLAGSGARIKAKDANKLGEALWSDPNRAETMATVMEYLVILLNGGKAPSDEIYEDDDAGDEGNA